MGQVLIRDLDDALIADYKLAAARHGRSLAAELRDGLARSRPTRRLVGSELIDTIHRLWELNPDRELMSDSTLLIREDRDAR